MQVRFCAVAAASAFRRTRAARLTTTLLMSGAILAGHAGAQSMPSGGQVIAGQANITGSGSQTVISQSSDKAIINWTDFSIAQGGEVNFNNGTGATLNRVTGGNLSRIDGLLNATGSVYLINPNGVIIGKTGVVNVGGSFVASALDLSNSGFLSGGDQTFAGPSLASVVNLGKIGALGGDVALMAVDVKNSGVIEAANGTAGLLAGRKIIMRDSSVNDGRFLIITGGADTAATNDGAIEAAAAELRAEGGNIYALAGNTAGVIRATGTSERGGKAWLTAGAGSVDISGSTITVSNAAGHGGEISVTGQTIHVAANATLDASATASNGHGGTILAIADMTSGKLNFQGTALAKGGNAGGDGGFIETSGSYVNFNGARINTSAPQGRGGNWLVDPFNLTIDATAASTISTNLASTGVTLQTTASGTSGDGTPSSGDGDIIINADINWSSANILTLDAYHSVQFNANVTNTGTGGAIIKTNNGGSGGDYYFAMGKSLSFSNTSGSLNINNNAYTLVSGLTGLATLTGGTGYYALAGNIDAASAGTQTASVVGNFLGNFTGLGHTITNLTINNSSTDYTGLFAENRGTVRDMGLIGGSVTGTTDYGYAGGLAGYNVGTLQNVYNTGTVVSKYVAGGLVGYNNFGGVVSNSFATGDILGYLYPDNMPGILYMGGGLVGRSAGSISNSYAMGSVKRSIYAGGLVGSSNGNISNSFATGAVTNSGSGLIGDLAGGTVTNSYYNSSTSGQTGGSGTALTTAQLQGALPSGFAGAWATGTGLYPYLKTFFPTGPQAISGMGYQSNGTSAAVGATIGFYANGSSLAITSTGANGYYYTIVAPGTITASTKLGGTLTLSGATAVSSLTYTDAPTLSGGNIVGANITSGSFSIYTHDASLSDLANALNATFGSASVASMSSSALPIKLMAASDFTVDSDLRSSGTLLLQANGNLTISAGGSLTSDASGNAIMAAANGAFVNAAGGNALTAANGRWLIYTQAYNDATGIASGNNFGALAGKGYYNDSYDFATSTLAATPATGNRFVTGYAANLTLTPDTKTLVYNGAAQTDTYNLSGYLSNADRSGDTLTGTVSGLTTGGKNVGDYSLAASGSLVSGENYTITYGTGTLSITQAALTLAAVTGTKTYDTTTISSGMVSVSGLKGSDTVTGLTQSYDDKNAGSRILGVNGGYIVNDGNSGGNYSVTTQTAFGTIDRLLITITADDLSKISGTSDPILTWHIGAVNLAGDDKLGGDIARASGENPGTYAITQGSLAASSNYNVAFVGAKFTIIPAGKQNQPVVNPIQSHFASQSTSFFQTDSGKDSGASDDNTGHDHQTCLVADDTCLNQPYPGNQSFSSYVSFLSH